MVDADVYACIPYSDVCDAVDCAQKSAGPLRNVVVAVFCTAAAGGVTIANSVTMSAR